VASRRDRWRFVPLISAIVVFSIAPLTLGLGYGLVPLSLALNVLAGRRIARPRGVVFWLGTLANVVLAVIGLYLALLVVLGWRAHGDAGHTGRPGFPATTGLAGEVGGYASRHATCHADTDLAEAPIEQYRPVRRARHPHLHDDPGTEAGLGRDGDVLPERSRANAETAQALDERPVVEVPATNHVHGVRPRGAMQRGPEGERPTAARGANLVDRAKDGQLMVRGSKRRSRRTADGEGRDRVS
jgi:hypothetical protein